FRDSALQLLPILVVWGFSFWTFGLYRPNRLASHLSEWLDIAKASTLGVLVLVAIMTFTFRGYDYSRVVIALFWAQSIVLVSFSRAVFREALRFARRRGYNQRYAIVVGGGEPAAEVLRVLKRRPDVGIRVLGLLADKVDTPGSDAPRLGGAPGGRPGHGARGARAQAHRARPRPLPSGAHGRGRPALPDAEVPHDARGRGARDRTGLGTPGRPAPHATRRVPTTQEPRRAATAVERVAGGDEPGRAAPRAPELRRGVPPPGARLHAPSQGQGGDHRLGAGQRLAGQHVDRRADQVRPPLHRTLEPGLRPQDPDPDPLVRLPSAQRVLSDARLSQATHGARRPRGPRYQ